MKTLRWTDIITSTSDSLSAVWFWQVRLNFLLQSVLKQINSVLNHLVFALYHIISVSNTKWGVKAFLLLLYNKPATSSKKKKMVLTEFCDFKIVAIKWYLNFVSCNFGLKSLLWLQIELALHLCNFEITVWFQTKLHSTQFNYYNVCLILQCTAFIWMSNKSTGQLIWSIAREASDLKVLQHACATDQTKKRHASLFYTSNGYAAFSLFVIRENQYQYSSEEFI